MKTIEEKAKAYDELTAKLKDWYNGLQDGSPAKETLEYLLPQFRASEDERIRKQLIAIMNFLGRDNAIFSEGQITKEQAIAYLEKQEQKPISAAEVLAKAGLKPYKDGNKWCILAGDNIQEGICGFGDTIDEALYEFLKEILDLQKEQKPAWSEEDEKFFQLLHAGLYAMKVKIGRDDYDKAVERLKSLRPQPHWKPSEEQMGALLKAEGSLRANNYKENAKILAGLYGELKKLM